MLETLHESVQTYLVTLGLWYSKRESLIWCSLEIGYQHRQTQFIWRCARDVRRGIDLGTFYMEMGYFSSESVASINQIEHVQALQIIGSSGADTRINRLRAYPNCWRQNKILLSRRNEIYNRARLSSIFAVQTIEKQLLQVYAFPLF